VSASAWQLREACPLCGALVGAPCVVVRAGRRTVEVRVLPVNLCHSDRVRAAGSRMVAGVASGVVAPPGVDPRQLALPGTEPRR
jgi:hypothetical protein